MASHRRTATRLGWTAFLVVAVLAVAAMPAWAANVTLRVESVGATAVPITGTNVGTTPYNVSVATGTTVTLVAPPVRGGGWVVDHWEDGVGAVLSTNAAVTTTVNAAMTLKVVYTNTATIYYVNNSSFAETNSVCTAAGNDANDGLAPSRPKATVQSVMSTYDLAGGTSVVYIDPGTYTQSFSILSSADSGARFIGAGSARTIFNVPATQVGFHANGYPARVEELSINGQNAAPQCIVGLNGGAVIRCKISRATGDGLAFGGDVLVQGCSFENNGGNGVVSGGEPATVTGNDSKNNAGAAYFFSGNVAARSSGNTGSGNGTNAMVIGTGWMVNTSGTFAPQPLPYRVRNNGGPWYGTTAVTISAGAVVNVDPGVRFEFESGTGIWVFGNWGTGTLNVNGTAANPVLFTSAQATPAAGDWLGINVQTYYSECSMTLAHATVEYAGAWNAAVPNNGASVTITDSVIRHSSNHGVYNAGTLSLTNSVVQNCAGHGLEYGDPATGVVDNCTFSSNNSGVNVSGSGVALTNCTASANTNHGLVISSGFGGSASGCTFTANGDNGVYGSSFSFTLTNNTSTNNTNAAYLVGGNLAMLASGNTATGNGTDAMCIGTRWLLNTSGDFTPQVLPFRVRNNGGPWSGTPALTISGGAVVNIDAGVRFEFESGTGLWVFGYWETGTLNVNGSAANPVVFTSAAATPAAGDWWGICTQYDYYGTYLTMSHAVVEYAGGNWSGAVNNSGTSATIADSVIRYSSTNGVHNFAALTMTNTTIQNCAGYGLNYDAASGALTNCAFSGSSTGIYAVGSGLTLTNCTASANLNHGLVIGGGTGSATGCTFSANTGYGVYGDSPSFTLTNNASTGNTNAAYLVGGNVAMLASGNTATGNGTDAIVIGTVWMLNTSGAFTPQVLPFRIRNNGGPWYGTPAVTISGGAVVNVDPGVRFEFEAGTGVWIYGYWGAGTLNVNGTAANPVLFTSAAATPAAGDWTGITIQNHSEPAGMTMTCGFVEYAGTGISVNGSTVTVGSSTIRHTSSHGLNNGGTLTVTDSAIHNCAGDGLYSSATLTLSGSSVHHCGGSGLTLAGGVGTADKCAFTANANGVNIAGGWGNVITNCAASANTSAGLNLGGGMGAASGCTFDANGMFGVHGNSWDFTLTGNAATNNGDAAYFIGGNVAMLWSANTATGNGTDAIMIGTEWMVTTSGTFVPQPLPYIVRNNGGPYYGTPSLTISQASTVNIAPGVRFNFESGTGLWVFGYWGIWGGSTLNVNGTAANPVVFTSAQATPSAGDWAGITIQDDLYPCSMTMTYGVVEYAGTGISVNGSTVTIDRSIIRHSGIHGFSNGGTATAVTNSLFANSAANGIYHSGAGNYLNCVMYGNGTGFALAGGTTPSVVNSILWGNTTDVSGVSPGQVFSYCDLGDASFAGTNGNISSDPMFVGPASGDFHLLPESPCIDSANGDGTPATDFDGNARRDDPAMPNTGVGAITYADMGAFEFMGAPQTAIVYVNDGVVGEPGGICTHPGNDANSGQSKHVPMRTIQAALNKYSAYGTGKTLWVDSGTFAENVSVASTHAGLKIQGAGADKSVVDGGQANTVFVLNNFGAGELSGLTIQNGKATGATALEKSGGGIRVNGASTALIANCILRNNAAGSGSGGGGIYTYNSSPAIKNCLVYANTGSGCGGVRTYNGAVTITNCTVANNTGGGIHKTGTGTLGITNCIVWEPTGDDLNACAATYSCIQDADAGTGNIAADPFFINAAGGDYRLSAWSPCIDAGSIASAPATDLPGNSRRDDANVAPNGSAYPDLGAYEWQSDSPNDVVYVNDAAFNEAGSVCTAAGNDANHGFSPRLPMRTIQGALNKYPAYGAGKQIWVDPGTYAENVNIVASHAGLEIKGAGADKCVVDGQQLNTVLIATNFGAGKIAGLTLQNGKATGATAIEKSGGGLRLYGASTALIANCIIRNNAAGTGSGGGGIYTYNASPTLRNLVVANNNGTGCGGIRTFGGAVTITNCTVANNTGGGIHKTGTGTLGITNSIVWANGDDLISATATYSCIEDGDAGTGNVSGNPMFVSAASGDYRIGGGSSAIDSADTAAAPATDILGVARRDDAGTLPNGDAYADMGAYEFTGTTVPPVLYVNDDSTDGDLYCTAVGDDANDGWTPDRPMRHIQALLNKYPAIGPRTLTIDTGTYAENVTITAAHAGWKLLGVGADKTILDGGQANSVIRLTAFGSGEIRCMTIQNGKATGATTLEKSGGGIRCYSGSNPLIANCIIKNNAAGTSCGGGGIYSYTSSPVIRNCLVHHNTGTGNGGIRTYSGTVSIMNCTVANNTASGIHKTGTGTLTITNTIAWENGDDLLSCTATYSCIQDGDAGTGNVSGNPVFINPAGGDYHLDPASSCINVGTPTGAPATDLDGTARDATPDIGAYEYES